MTILPFYAALLVLLFVVLSIRTLRLRRGLKIGVGDGGNPQMLRAMRVHSNFAEYVPLALLMVYLVEGRGAHPVFVHALGLAHPAPERLGRAPDLAGNGFDRRPLRRVLVLDVEHHAHSALDNLGGKLR